MRTAAICPTCATYENAKCIIYNGPFLSNIQVNPLEDLPTILGKINNNLVPKTGTTAPSTSATYRGQLYLNTTNSILYFAKSIGFGVNDWSIVLTTPTATLEFADNSSALFAGLVPGQIYRTGDFIKIVH
jgi:hypothetical protein